MVGREPRDATPGHHAATLEHPRGEMSGDSGPEGRGDNWEGVGDEDDDVEVETPKQLGRFHVLEELGHGGMGMVFLAEDPDLGRRVAIKLLHERVELASRGRARLEREARALAALSHPNVVHVYEIGSHDGHVFVAMERVPGQSLKEWLSERPRSWREIVDMFCTAGDGLAAAHKAGIVHRDFKPDNVIVDPEGRPRVLDFGLATPSIAEDTGDNAEHAEVQLDGLTATGTVMGTPAYMSPEQHTGGPPDARSDQFSFCVALFEALFGVRPFRGDTLDRLRRAVVQGRISPPPSKPIPRRIVAAVRRGLAPSPADRHASMHDLLAELRDAAATSWRRPAIAVGVGAIALAIAIAVVRPRESADEARTVADATSTTLPAASEPWRLTSRPLTKTSAPGVDTASIDPRGALLVYATNGETWRRPLSGGTPEPVDVPGSGYPWWVTLASGDGATYGLVDGKLWRFAGAQGPATTLDRSPVTGHLAISRDAVHVAAVADERLTIVDVASDARTELDFPHEHGAGGGWSPSGALLAAHTRKGPTQDFVRILDARGRILAWLELARAHDGVAWVAEDRLVASFGTYTELGFVCLAFDAEHGTLAEIGRSESLEHPYAQITVDEATDDGRVLVRMARSIRDVVVVSMLDDPRGVLLSPELEAGNRSAGWLDGDRLAMVSERDVRPTAVVHELAAGRDVALAGISAPLRRLSTTSDGTLVAIVEAHAAEPAALVILPSGAVAPRVVASSSAVAEGALDVRCDGASACVILSDAGDGLRFHTLDPRTLELVAHAKCPPSHACTAGTFAPSADASRVLLPVRGFKRLEWLSVATGEALAQGPAGLDGYEVGSATPIPGTNDVVATMTLDGSARSTLPTYVLARLSPTAAPTTLWTSPTTYLRRAVLSPDGTQVALDGATFHTEAVLVEGAQRCRNLP